MISPGAEMTFFCGYAIITYSTLRLGGVPSADLAYDCHLRQTAAIGAAAPAGFESDPRTQRVGQIHLGRLSAHHALRSIDP